MLFLFKTDIIKFKTVYPKNIGKKGVAMALIHVDYFSQALAGQTDFWAVLPNDVPPMMLGQNPHYGRKPVVLVLLHGYSGNASDWITGSPIRELAGEYNLAVLMPNGRNSFYVDKESTGEKYAQFVGEELLDYAGRAFGLDVSPENCMIGGFSMGGYGALHTGLISDRYSRVIALSSALIVNGLAGMPDDNPIANKAYYRSVFGDLQTAAQTDHNPEVLVKQRKAEGKALPKIFMACGSEDFLIGANNAFDEFLKEQGVAHEYRVTPGIHNWKFWNSCLVPALDWALA